MAIPCSTNGEFRPKLYQKFQNSSIKINATIEPETVYINILNNFSTYRKHINIT